MLRLMRKIVGPGGKLYLWLPIKNVTSGPTRILCPQYDDFSSLTIPGWIEAPSFYTDTVEEATLTKRLYFNGIGNPFLIIPANNIYNLKITGFYAYYSFKSNCVEFMSESILANFEKAPEKFSIKC